MTLRRLLALTASALAGAVVLLVVLAGAAIVALSHGWQRERIRAELEARLQSALSEAGVRGELRIGALSGPLLPELTLRDVSLERDGVSVARIGSASLELDLRRLYAERRVIVSRLRVEDAALSVAPDARGAWPWTLEPPRPAEPIAPATARPISLEIRELELAALGLDATWTQTGRPSHVAGTLAGTLHGWVLPRSGDPSWPDSAQASLSVEPGIVAGRALLGAELSAALDGSQLRLDPSHFESAFGTLRVTGQTDLAGWLDPDARASARLEGEADALDLAVMLARPDLAGTVGGKLRLDATHEAGTPLEDSRAELVLALTPSRVGRLSIASGEVRGVYDKGRWQLERAQFASNAGRLTARGSGDLERITSLEAKLDISDLGTLAAVASADARGSARAGISLSGTWRAPSGTLELETQDLRVAGFALGRVQLRARSSGLDRYRIEPLSLDAPDLQLAADGPVLLRRAAGGVRIERAQLRSAQGETIELGGTVSPKAVRGLRIELAHVALARVGALAGVEESLGGRLSGVLTADGPLPRPALQGHLTWDSPQLGDVSADAIAVDLVTRDGQLRADGRISARGRDLLTASFATPWSARADPARALERPETVLQVRGKDLELSLLEELVPATLTRVGGKADLRIELRGGTPEPALDGELSIEDARCEVPSLVQSFGPLDAHLVLAGETLRVDAFRLRAGDRGLVEGTGEVKLANLRPALADLRLAVHDFPVRWQTTLQAQANGALSLRGPPESLLAQGELELSALRYSLAGGSDPLLGEVTIRDSSAVVRAPRAPRAAAPEFYDRASVDVKIDIAKDGRVQGQGANLEIGGQLLAAKSPSGPLVVKGAIDTHRGSYRIHGKTFIVELAHVAFTGRPDLDPDLDVRAMHRVRNIRVYALVRGRASAPQIQLSSDPPYPQDDVLALLLFGKTRDELSQQQAGALQSAIASSAGAAALDSLSERLGFDIPLDTLEVGDSNSKDETEVGIGSYLTEDVFVRYGRGFGTDSQSNVRVDWRFQKRWSVETSFSTTGDSSADLIWNYDY
ncbi:MAG: translocation/assembly module TamB domain-containing protein [Myxococcota bacterium]